MLGENADWLPGVDHAAIATEAVLVRELAREGLRREDLGRERFVERAWEWSRTYGGAINEQFRRLGFGADWERSRFTMDDGFSAAVRRVFVRLYREGLIYRGTRLINWDPTAQTTVSDAELEHVERDGTLWRVRYPFAREDPAHGIEVATTRPETMLGDVAIAVHPNDERYAGLVGRSVWLPPLLERAIPIVADEAVDPEFGTGAVKVTPAHDADRLRDRRAPRAADAVGHRPRRAHRRRRRRRGPVRGPGSIRRARARSSKILRSAGLLVDAEPHRHAVATSERSGDVVEPLLSLQWFVRGRAARAARPGGISRADASASCPSATAARTSSGWRTSATGTSRVRSGGGTSFPSGTRPTAAKSSPKARTRRARSRVATYGTSDLTRDPDTLDTWFSSGLWPFSILGWPERTTELDCWYPSQVLVTGGRDHLPVGRAHGDAGPALHGRRAVSRRRHHAARLRRRRTQDVEVARQRHRSDGSGREVRRRRRSGSRCCARCASRARRCAIRSRAAKRRATSTTRSGTRRATCSRCPRGCPSR